MKNLQCILCGSDHIKNLESINTVQLARLYKKRARVDVRRFFSENVIDYCECQDCGLKFYWPQAVGDGKFYDELQHYKGYYLEEKAEFIEASKYVSQNDDVLEIGSGEGMFTNFIRCKSYTGLEFSDNAISIAKEKGISILKQSIEDHAAQYPEEYDVVCYFQVLEHVPNPGKFIKDSLQCLKTGGKLMIAVPSEDSFISEAVNFYLNMPPHHSSRWTDHTLKKIAELNQLKVITIFHEPLHIIHRKFYRKTKIYKLLSSANSGNARSIDLGVSNAIKYGLSTIFSHLPILSDRYNIGQSVLIIFEKSNKTM